MKRLMNGTASFVLLIVLAFTLSATNAHARLVGVYPAPQYHRGLSSTEFLLEGGLAVPVGDQADPLYLVSDDPTANPLGLGQGAGYELGFRVRQYMSENFAVAPAFHFIKMGSASGGLDYDYSQDLGFTVGTWTYKYGLDFNAFMGGPGSSVQPYLTGGIALAHNVYQDELQYGGIYKTSVDNAAYSVGLGFKMKNIELSGEYTFNRFDSASLPPDQGNLHYNWDYYVVRMGISFGR